MSIFIFYPREGELDREVFLFKTLFSANRQSTALYLNFSHVAHNASLWVTLVLNNVFYVFFDGDGAGWEEIRGLSQRRFGGGGVDREGA